MSINPSSLNRITGLASGMDTDSLVKKLMSGEQVQIDQLKQKQQKETWLSDAYRQWNTDLLSFQNDLFNMKFSSTYNTFNVTSSQPDSVSGAAGGGTMTGTYNIAVKQLAQPASFIGTGVNIDTTKTLGDQNKLSANASISIKVYSDPQNPSTAQTANIAINTTDKIGDVINKINSATDSSGKSLGLQANYDSNLQQFIIKTKATGQAAKIDLSGNADGSVAQSFLTNTLGIGSNASVTGTAVVNPVTIKSGSNDTLSINLGNSGSASITLTAQTYNSASDLVTEINNQLTNNTNANPNFNSILNGVKASLDPTSCKIILTSPATGTQSSISVTGDSASSLGFNSNNPTSPTTAQGLVTTGQNADIVFNNQELTNLSSNNTTILGTNWSFKSPTLDSNGHLLTSTINVSQDIDTEVKNIKDFISKYNDLLDKLNTAESEPVYSDYQPLTDAQRSAMSDTQITQWETKAKSGLLHSDSILSSLINNMRNDMTSTVNNGSSYNSLAAIGISSSSWTDKGKLYVDDTKLRTAIQNDPDAVKNLFSNLDTVNSSKNGLMNKLDTDISSAMTSLTDKAGSTGDSQYDQSTIGKLLTSIQTDISNKTDSFNQKENQYYAQFSAMEQAMSKFTSQSNWLTSQLSGGGGA